MRKTRRALVLLFAATAPSWPQQTPAASGTNGVYTVSDGAKAPKLVHGFPAVYPAAPDLADQKRSCTLSVVIGADGIPTKIQSEDADPDPFDAAAIAAVKQSEFKSGTLHGQPVPVQILIWVPFLPGKKPFAPEVLPVPYDSPPTATHTVAPSNSTGPRKVKFHGLVVVSLVVTDRGFPTDLRIEKSVNQDLDAKGMEAISQYRFKPATKYGLPIPASIVIQVDFNLY
jgi:TonB family protein